MKPRYRIVKYFLLALTVLLVLDFVPMVYSRITGNGGTFVEHYYYDLKPDVLIERVKKIKSEDTSLQSPRDTSLTGKCVNNWMYVNFFDKENNEYFHTWILVNNRFGNDTWLVFYGVSSTPDWKDAKRINIEYDYLSRMFVLKRFKVLIKNKIDNY